MAGEKKPEPVQKRLRIVSCSPVYTGEHDNGVKFTIHEVTAVKPSGEVVDVSLRSFENLPLEELDVLVTLYRSERYGVSYTLARKRHTRREMDELRTKVEELEARLAELESR